MRQIFAFLYLLSISHFLVAQEKDKAILSGYVKDAESGEALIGASVYVESLQLGVTTNLYGFYSLSLPKGRYKVSISYL